jgi:diguanylate cyclase (GGDEF)-like protein/PAS domain S-box-containing protein
MLKFKNSQLGNKIFYTTSVVLCTVFIIGSCVIYFILHGIISSHLENDLSRTVNNLQLVVEKSVSLSIRSYLRAVAHQFIENSEYYYDQVHDGLMDEGQAKQLAAQRMLKKSIGQSGYIYVIDSKAIVQVHPKESIVGRDYYEELFVKQQINRKSGFLEYEWRNPDEEMARQKILYMEYFEPWDWIISVSAYRDELTQLVSLEDFKDEVLSMKIDNQGYAFVVAESGDILAHSHLGDNVFEKFFGAAHFMRKLIESKRGKEFYDWQDPRDGKLKKKIVIYDSVDDYGWIVAATGYVDDFYAPLDIVRNILFVLLFVALLASFFISYFLSRSIMSPLHDLLQLVTKKSSEKGFQGGLQSENNEIRRLANVFIRYINQLDESNTTLQKMYVEQKNNAFNLSIFKEVFENVVEGISITDDKGNIVLVNPAFTKITGYSQEEVIGVNPRILKSNRHGPDFYSHMWTQILEDGFWSGEIWNKRKNGEIYPEWLTITAVKNVRGETGHYAAIFNDITMLIEQKEKIHFLAYHDHLTNLPNRLMIIEILNQSLEECKRHGGSVACLVIDLNNFKTFNDSIGQDYGDKLLEEYVKRSQVELRGEDQFGRIGGDDFVLIVDVKGSRVQNVIPIVERLFENVDSPFEVAEHKIHLTLSIGISFFPSDASCAEDLIKKANLALGKAKQGKGNSYAFFNQDMEEAVSKKLHFLENIRFGIEKREFLPFYQPKVNLLSGKVYGVEALARWRSDGELINPGNFIPLSEESGLVIPLSKQIYEKAFQEIKILHTQGIPLHLSVNLSPAQFVDEFFLENFLAIQKSSDLEEQFIELELTESILLENVQQTREQLAVLSDLDFSISIDDFGTGYSSLQYLKQLPLNTLKIDMAFVSGIGKSKDDERLIQTIVLLAKQFDLKIVAEGVEEKVQVDFLRALGCEAGQGHFYGKPMDFEELQKWLTTRETV